MVFAVNSFAVSIVFGEYGNAINGGSNVVNGDAVNGGSNGDIDDAVIPFLFLFF